METPPTNGHQKPPSAIDQALAGVSNLKRLSETHFPEPVWAVQGLIPEGTTLLGGRPKCGKSWFSLQLGLSVATGTVFLGHYQVRTGSVLYLALEDNERRMKIRTSALAHAMSICQPETFCFTTKWLKPEEGGLVAIERWLDTHSDARFVCVDTLARFKTKAKGSNAYMDDYAAMEAFQKLALDRGIPFLAVTHTRKPKTNQDEGTEDLLDEINGTSGLTGAADTILVLRHPRGKKTGTLFVTGRDIEEETDIQLDFNPVDGLWKKGWQAPNDGLTDDQRKLIAAVAAGNKKPDQIRIAAGKPQEELENVTRMLSRLAKDGRLIRPRHGEYDIPVSECPNDRTEQPHRFEAMCVQ